MSKLAMPLIYLVSDNFDSYVTKEAYKEITLQMSTGDFHMHKHTEITEVDPMSFAAKEDVYDIFPEDDFKLEVIGSVKDFIAKERLYLDEIPELHGRLENFCKELKLDLFGSGAENFMHEIECRRRDGFIPHAHNRGGFDVYNTLETECGENEDGNDDTMLLHGFRIMYEGYSKGVHTLCAYYIQFNSEDPYGMSNADTIKEIEIKFRKEDQLFKKLRKFTKEFCK